MGDVRELLANANEAMQSGDFGRMTELVIEYGTEDFVEEWPQSGERVPRAAVQKMYESYPEMSGTSPKFTFKRLLTGGDIFVAEGTIDYGDGIPVSYVGIGEISGDKVSRMTEYFANPFEAPEWRKPYVDRIVPTES